jgi:hypothetical protein
MPTAEFFRKAVRLSDGRNEILLPAAHRDA